MYISYFLQLYVDPHVRQPIEPGTFKPLAPSPHMMHPSQSTSALQHMNHVAGQGVPRSSSGSNLRSPNAGSNSHIYQDSDGMMTTVPYNHRMRPHSHDPRQHHAVPQPQHHRESSDGGYSSRPTSGHHRESSDSYSNRPQSQHHRESSDSYPSSRSQSAKSSRSYQNPNVNRNNVGGSQRLSPSSQRRVLNDAATGGGSGRNSPSGMRRHVPIDEQSPMLHRIQSNNWPNERPVPVRQFYDERQFKVQGGVSHHGSMSSLHQPQERHSSHERNTRAGRSLDGSDPTQASPYALLSSCSSGGGGRDMGGEPASINSKRMQAVHAAHSGGRNSPKMGTSAFQSTHSQSTRGRQQATQQGHPHQQAQHPPPHQQAQHPPPTSNRIPGTSFSSSFH